ncbi:MAG TPA: GSCFA domain-containing protein [Aequorivita sp.]|nr:GSCFA domain-containing protein [Aequorivita sp.]
MKLQTEIPLYPQENRIDYSSKILLLGSCFSENIGGKFDYCKFQNLQNPFGVIFNPVSIGRLVIRAIENELFSEADVFQHNGMWKCFETHSELSCLDKDELIRILNDSLHLLRRTLFSSTHIIFTYGTSWVYRHLESDKIVANCHKLPQKNFKKELLSIDIISKSIQNTIDKISTVNKRASIIITVSPVRHIKDGFVENSLSKSHLISAIHTSTSLEQRKFQPYYFPSYEIMMDELRDYRYYSEDMLHPNKTAIEVIWEKFSKVWVSANAESLQKEIASIQNGLLHKPFNPLSEEHLRFSKTLQYKISAVQQKFPHIQFKISTQL